MCESLNNGRDQPPEPHAPGCNGIGSQCDHIVAGDNHAMTNLQWLSIECHQAKTRRESDKGKANRVSGARMGTEQHPGMITAPPMTCGNTGGPHPP